MAKNKDLTYGIDKRKLFKDFFGFDTPDEYLVHCTIARYEAEIERIKSYPNWDWSEFRRERVQVCERAIEHWQYRSEGKLHPLWNRQGRKH